MSSIFRPCADRLGLSLIPADAGYFSSFEMSGVIAGHVVRVGRDPMMRQLRTQVYFATPFDLGLKVAPAGQPSVVTPAVTLRPIGRVLSRVFGSHDMRIGDAAIDDAFAIHGDEEPRVALLLAAARDALLAWYATGVAFEFDDARVRVRRHYSLNWGDSPDGAGMDVESALDLAKRLEAVRASLPVAAALAPHEHTLRAFAVGHALQLSTTPLAAWGVAGHVGYRTFAARVAPESFELETSIHRDGCPQLGGVVRSVKGKQGAVFDEAFAATNGDVGAHVPEEARKQLLELVRMGHAVVLDDQGLHMRTPLSLEPYPFEDVADRAAAALRALG